MKDSEGTIPRCANSGCVETLGFRRCCDFQQGNYIVLHPGELATAAAQGVPIAHLRILDPNYYGGHKVICEALDPVTCDGGLKPFDCRAYPIFPVASPSDDYYIKGHKCPLSPLHLVDHAEYVRNAWREIVSRHPEAVEWLGKVELVGYSGPARYG